jgi:glutamine amidotransferase
MKTAVLDYEGGNLRSVESALKCTGVDYFITRDVKKILESDALVFPGVGEARSAMDVLNSTGLGEAVVKFSQCGKPLLGICIGCQVALSHTEERDTDTLGLMEGFVKKFPHKPGFKVPQMGWNQVVHTGSKLFEGLEKDASFYFVHSYYPLVSDLKYALSMTDYIIDFTSSFGKDNMVFTQFHPEKSGPNGLKFLSNFFNLARKGKVCC